MSFNINTSYLIDCFKDIVNVPSPVGYYVKFKPVLNRYAESLGYTCSYDNRSTGYITVEGEDSSKTVLVGAHADTIGAVVRGIDSDGTLLVRELGGINYSSIEGNTVTVHTRHGRDYTGLFACKYHSVHIFEKARSETRDETNTMVILDERVSSKEDVKALGIQNGDFISFSPNTEITPNGYLKSRFIDNRGAIACVFEAIRYLNENNLKPKYNTIFAFPFDEETGLGGTYVPSEVSEYVAMDIGLIGPEHDGNEYSVSICAKDAANPYDYDLTCRLIDYAKKAGCDYAVDVYKLYGTDGNAAQRGGNNVKSAAFGMAVTCSHSRERTHITGLENTAKLLLAYLLDI
ncbi:MAG: M42 family metallopeptidase [Clostridiales bacterium]|nr:M42 family metallopeptidase [Clostridiales bacterium]